VRNSELMLCAARICRLREMVSRRLKSGLLQCKWSWRGYFSCRAGERSAEPDSRFSFLSCRETRAPTIQPDAQRTAHMISNHLDCSCGKLCPSEPSGLMATVSPRRRCTCIRKRHPASLKSLTLVRSANRLPVMSTPAISTWAFMRRRLSVRRSREFTIKGASSFSDNHSP
jgi:hypothetical protein